MLERRRLLTASLASVCAYDDLGIAGVGDVVWSSVSPAAASPVADGIVETASNPRGLRLVANFDADGSATHFDWSWSVVGTGCAGSGQFLVPADAQGGFSRDVLVAVPQAIGLYDLRLQFEAVDANGVAIGQVQTITPKLYVTWSDPIGGGAMGLNYLDRATRFAAPADGRTDNAESAVADLNSGIYSRNNWRYVDLSTPGADLINGKANSGNCISMAQVFVELGRALGLGVWYETGIIPNDYAGFVTQTAVAFDGKTGNAHRPGAAPDRWVFTSHYIAKYNGKWYDPTFGQIYATSATEFIDWYRKKGSNITMGGEAEVRQLSSSGWGDWEYKVIVSEPAVLDNAQTPFGGKAIELPVSGGVVIEAENFDVGRDTIAYHDTDAANLGGAYRTTGVDVAPIAEGGDAVTWVRAGEWLEYSVHAGAARTYTVNFRIASNGAGGSMHLDIDGVNVTGAIAVPDTGGWQTYQILSRSGIPIGAGDHVLRLVMDSAGSSGFVGNIDWIKAAVPAPVEVVPPASTPRVKTIQAEAFASGGEGVGYHDSDAINRGGAYRPKAGVDIAASTDSGGGYMVGWTRPGEWLSYTVSIAEAGLYTFDFRMAAAGQGGSFHLEVDGRKVGGSIAVPNTKSWETWRTISKIGISLSAGKHTLRLVFDKATPSGKVANFNWLRFTKS